MAEKQAEKKAEEVFDAMWGFAAEQIDKAAKAGNRAQFLRLLRQLAEITGVAKEFRNEGKQQAEQTQRGRSPPRGRSKSPARGRRESPARGKSPGRGRGNAQDTPCKYGESCEFHKQGKCRFGHELNTRRPASPTGPTGD